MIYIFLIIIIWLLLSTRKNIVNHRINREQIDLTHLYAMLALVPRKFDTKEQRDFYIRTYQRETPMFYSASFEIALDIEKFLKSEDTKDWREETKDEILKEYNEVDFGEVRTGVDIKIRNDRSCEPCLYAAEKIFGISLRVDATKDKIELPSVGFIGRTEYFDFQDWINREMHYHRYQAWQENPKNIPPWHIRENGEWGEWKVIYEEWEEPTFHYCWFFEKDYIRIFPHLEIWDRCGRNVKEYNLESELPEPLSEE